MKLQASLATPCDHASSICYLGVEYWPVLPRISSGNGRVEAFQELIQDSTIAVWLYPLLGIRPDRNPIREDCMLEQFQWREVFQGYPTRTRVLQAAAD